MIWTCLWPIVRIGHTVRDRIEACDVAADLLPQSQSVPKFEGCSRIGFWAPERVEIGCNNLGFADQVDVCLKNLVSCRFFVIDGEMLPAVNYRRNLVS